jgi:hypothetical protein
MRKWACLAILVSSAVLVSLAIVELVRHSLRGARRAHAREALKVVSAIADRAVGEVVPAGRYLEAVAAAEYIEGFYPVGSVLSRQDPMADEYERERAVQIERVLDALEEATGLRHGRDWAAWRASLAEEERPGPSEHSL